MDGITNLLPSVTCDQWQSTIVETDYRARVDAYLRDTRLQPLLLLGDAQIVLEQFPQASIDMVMTSPPYWGKREYEDGGIGMEDDYRDYICYFTWICCLIKRALKPEGSFWLNLGDTYHHIRLLGILWRVALELTDYHGWILRNSVIWNKVKSGMDTSKNRLGNVHEYVFHFVKQPKYYYNVDAIRSKPRQSRVVNGSVISATGVSGVRYRRQIERSTALSDEEK
jgi:site-specific DNA-methyltransferase (adenine-specific)